MRRLGRGGRAVRGSGKNGYYGIMLMLLLILLVIGYWYMSLPIPEEIPSRSLKI